MTTVTSGGKPMKLAARFTVSQASPSPVNSPRTAVSSSAPGMVTDVPTSWSTVGQHADDEEQAEEQQERVGQAVAEALDRGERAIGAGGRRGAHAQPSPK